MMFFLHNNIYISKIRCKSIEGLIVIKTNNNVEH